MKLPLIMTMAGLLVSSYGTSEAASVIVKNFSFEDEVLSAGNYNTSVQDWMVAGGKIGTQYFTGNSQFDTTNPLAAPASGYQAVYAYQSGMLYQDVGELQANTLYTLTVAVGSRKDWADGANGGTIYLYNGASPSGTLLAASNDFVAAKGTFQDLTITFTTGNTVSGNLTIGMKQTSGTNTIFDNVRLTAVAVPEPSGLVLIPAMGGILLFRRRKS